MPLEKFGTAQNKIPYIGRKIYIKWWDKYDFFFSETSIFSTKGVIDCEPKRSREPPTQNSSSKNGSISKLLIKLLEKTSREELKKQLKELMIDSNDEIESQRSNDCMKTE